MEFDVTEAETEVGYFSHSETFIETFLNFYEASRWLEAYLDETPLTKYTIEQASLVYMNGAYRVGLVRSLKQQDFFAKEEVWENKD